MPERGEVWQVDFGITQKVRPALAVSIPFADEGVQALPPKYFLRRLGRLTPEQFKLVESVLLYWFGVIQQ